MIRKERGSVTIFLSLTLMLLISFVCTALRSAQAAGSRYLFTVANEAAAQSVFGAYDTRVWEQYRVLMLTDQQLAATIGRECAETYEKSGTLFSLTDLTVELTDGVTLAQDGAKGWEEAIVSYMEVRLPVDLVSHWVEQLDLLEGLQDMAQWLIGFRDLLKPLLQLEQKLCRLEEKLTEAVETYQRGKGLLQELKTCCEAVGELLSMADTGIGGTEWNETQAEDPGGSSDGADQPFDQAAFDEAWAALAASYEKIQKYLRDSGWQLDALAAEAEEDLEAAADLQTLVTQLLESLAGDDSGLGALADLGGYLSGLTKRFDFLQDLPGEFAGLRDYLQRVEGIRLPTAEEALSGAGQETLGFLQGLMEGFVAEVWDPDTLEMDRGTEEEEQRVGILLQLRSWLDQGVLGLVMKDPGQVSQASLGRTMERSDRQDHLSLMETAYRRALCTEYVLQYTADGVEAIGGKGSRADTGDRSDDGSDGGGLRYETEYVIAGHAQDLSNLAAVAGRLLLTRGALNLLYLLQNGSSQESLQLAAAGLSAALGGWIPQGLMMVLLMVVWAMAEAVCDVRTLLSGGQIPLWKDAASWKLALEHLWTLLEDGFVTGIDRPEGMSYQEYLRLLLYLVPTSEMCYRIMEVAEENLRVARKDFCIDQGWCQAMVVLSGKVAGSQMQQKVEYGY